MMEAEVRGVTVQERALVAIDQLLARAMDHAGGLERTLLRQAINRLYPRLRQRILSATDGDIRQEVEHLQRLLASVLGTEATVAPPARPTAHKRRRSAHRRAQPARRRRTRR
ncbi:hypothetical protein [Alicyclobacillus kakegawensis]|uniref:hypothetical protein n=1 Tax=Alicyclobacillus kakegawensis TaxID=392012 RepID=UPI00082C8288|nr:hypothetical protein [Alicyclobacillus kakegawensis]